MNKIYFKNQVTMKKVTIIATVALCFLAVGIVAQNQSKKNQEVLNPVSQGINNNEQRSLFTDIKDQDMYLQTSDGRILDLKGNTLSSQMQTNLRLEKFERKTYEVNYLDVVVPILSKFTRVETEGVDKLANSRITPTLDPGISVIEANGGDYKFKVNTKFVLERMNREEHLSYEGEMKNGDLFESYSNKSTPVMSYGLIKKDGEKIIFPKNEITFNIKAEVYFHEKQISPNGNYFSVYVDYFPADAPQPNSELIQYKSFILDENGNIVLEVKGRVTNWMLPFEINTKLPRQQFLGGFSLQTRGMLGVCSIQNQPIIDFPFPFQERIFCASGGPECEFGDCATKLPEKCRDYTNLVYSACSFPIGSTERYEITYDRCGHDKRIAFDLAGKVGIPIIAAGDGEVIYSREYNAVNYPGRGYGTCIVIRYASGFDAIHGHMKAGSIPERFRVGKREVGNTSHVYVKKGEQIGIQGNTDELTNIRDHLHWEFKNKIGYDGSGFASSAGETYYPLMGNERHSIRMSYIYYSQNGTPPIIGSVDNSCGSNQFEPNEAIGEEKNLINQSISNGTNNFFFILKDCMEKTKGNDPLSSDRFVIELTPTDKGGRLRLELPNVGFDGAMYVYAKGDQGNTLRTQVKNFSKGESPVLEYCTAGGENGYICSKCEKLYVRIRNNSKSIIDIPYTMNIIHSTAHPCDAPAFQNKDSARLLSTRGILAPIIVSLSSRNICLGESVNLQVSGGSGSYYMSVKGQPHYAVIYENQRINLIPDFSGTLIIRDQNSPECGSRDVVENDIIVRDCRPPILLDFPWVGVPNIFESGACLGSERRVVINHFMRLWPGIEPLPDDTKFILLRNGIPVDSNYVGQFVRFESFGTHVYSFILKREGYRDTLSESRDITLKSHVPIKILNYTKTCDPTSVISLSLSHTNKVVYEWYKNGIIESNLSIFKNSGIGNYTAVVRDSMFCVDSISWKGVALPFTASISWSRYRNDSVKLVLNQMGGLTPYLTPIYSETYYKSGDSAVVACIDKNGCVFIARSKAPFLTSLRSPLSSDECIDINISNNLLIFSSEDQKGRATVYDIWGRVIKLITIKPDSEYQIEIPIEGVYLFVFESDVICTRKFIVIK